MRLGVPPLRAVALALAEASITVAQKAGPHGATWTVTLPLGLTQRPSIGALASAGEGAATRLARMAVRNTFFFMLMGLAAICGDNGAAGLRRDERAGRYSCGGSGPSTGVHSCDLHKALPARQPETLSSPPGAISILALSRMFRSGMKMRPFHRPSPAAFTSLS